MSLRTSGSSGTPTRTIAATPTSRAAAGVARLDCRWEGGVTKDQMAAYADGHAKLTMGIPRPQWYENMALDGKVYVPFQGCP